LLNPRTSQRDPEGQFAIVPMKKIAREMPFFTELAIFFAIST
jgi:hypothetical protein